MKIFVYETLLDNKVLSEALHGHKVSEKDATLPGFEEVWEGDYPTLKKKFSGKVKGRTFNVYGKDIDLLDQWESKYHRKKIFLENGDEAQVYILKSR